APRAPTPGPRRSGRESRHDLRIEGAQVGAHRGRYCGSQAKATVRLSHGLDLSAHRREPLRKPAEAIPSRRLRHAPAVVDDVDLDMGGISAERDPASLSARMPDHIG